MALIMASNIECNFIRTFISSYIVVNSNQANTEMHRKENEWYCNNCSFPASPQNLFIVFLASRVFVARRALISPFPLLS